MNPTISFGVLVLSFQLAISSFAQASENWPQWRGPTANGVAQANPPLTWSETENVKWKVKIPGFGSSTPIIWGDQVFITTAIPTGKKKRGKKA